MIRKFFLMILTVLVLSIGCSAYALMPTASQYLIPVCKNNKWGAYK